jgi:hypothetical protein
LHSEIWVLDLGTKQGLAGLFLSINHIMPDQRTRPAENNHSQSTHVKQSSKTYVFRISAIHPTWQYFRSLQLWKQALRYQSVKHIAVTNQRIWDSNTDLNDGIQRDPLQKQRREGG